MINIFLKYLSKKINNIEFKNRTFLSRHQILYALLGGAGVVLYWRGVWSFSDYLESKNAIFKIIFSPLGSIILGIVILLGIGLLVQEFIGTDIILSGLKKEKKRDIDKSEKELIREDLEDFKQEKLIKEIDKHLHDIEKKLSSIKDIEDKK
ncbi:MAG: hypothetical protein KBD12_02900 [Candidatus Pacebacteria bacterium]|nr:hypothetical protein [Candidatus Paceibacterota bacterium]